MATISECSESWKTCSNDKGSSPISYDLTGRYSSYIDSNFLQLHIHQASRNCLANFVWNESIKFSSLKFACNIKPRQSPQSQTAYLSKSHSYFQGEPEWLKVAWHIFRGNTSSQRYRKPLIKLRLASVSSVYRKLDETQGQTYDWQTYWLSGYLTITACPIYTSQHTTWPGTASP